MVDAPIAQFTELVHSTFPRVMDKLELTNNHTH